MRPTDRVKRAIYGAATLAAAIYAAAAPLKR
jgi:hypothetical protein